LGGRWRAHACVCQQNLKAVHIATGGPDVVSIRFAKAKASGLSVVRMWGSGNGGSVVLQYSPTGFNEDVFKAFDYIVFQARQYNIRVCSNPCLRLLVQ
jgi:hypothetical protein